MSLAQGHNAVMPVILEPATPISRVKHSTTEPLRSLNKTVEPRHEKMGRMHVRNVQTRFSLHKQLHAV